MSQTAEPKLCPECGRGELIEITFREGSTQAEGEPIQEADTRQVETYSCGHEVIGPPLDRTAAGSDALEVERRDSGDTVEPL